MADSATAKSKHAPKRRKPQAEPINLSGMKFEKALRRILAAPAQTKRRK
jgi:hypothetical protein